MGFGKTVWATVTGGVLLIFISWGLESIKTKLPGWAEAFIDVAWAPVAVPRAVAWITAIAIGFLVVDFFITSRREAEQKMRRPDEAVEKKPEPTVVELLSHEERLVFDAIIYGQPPVDYGDLMLFTKLSRIRLGHAINVLAEKSLINIDDDPYGHGDQLFSLSPEGAAFVVKHDLDKIPI